MFRTCLALLLFLPVAYAQHQGCSQLPDGTWNCGLLPTGVSSIDAQTGAFTFAGAVSHVGNAYTFTGGASGFNSVTSGTNTTAAMLVGSGASLAPTGTGTIQATNIASTISAGSGVGLSGSGTTSSPYVISASGGVSSVTGTSPIVSSGGSTPAISCPTCMVNITASLTASGACAISGNTATVVNSWCHMHSLVHSGNIHQS